MLESYIKDYNFIDKNTNVAVIGTGASGRAAIKLLHKLNANIRILENNISNIPQDFLHFIKEKNITLIEGEHKKEHFDGLDLIIPSPGVSVHTLIPFLGDTPPAIISETELGSRFLDNQPIIAITGTSGKTTTTSLIGAMLEEHGLKIFVGGNIGTPLSEYTLSNLEGENKVDVIVLELSSFQLQTTHNLKPKVALLLNLSENHLDYHKDMQEYIDAKMRIFQCQDSEDIALFNKDLEEFSKPYFFNSTKDYFENIEDRFSKSNLFGKHNLLNAEAAYSATKHFGVTLEEAKKAVEKFKPIEHRLEKVVEANNVLFINDSKGTTAESLKIALQSFNRPILLLVGGKFKGGDLEGLIPLLKEKVKKVMLFGGSRTYFENAWKNVVPLDYKETLKEATTALYNEAKENDVILFSPATSSFDQYKSYIMRGIDFKNIANSLANSNSTQNKS